MLYFLLVIILFCMLIAIHEFGHFITAKLSGVRVNEFAIGMGPLLWSRQKGETQYSLRLLPVGGYCAMEGEDGESDDPRSFGAQSFWKKAVILAAGSFMNFVAGFLLILLLLGQNTAFYVPVIGELYDGFPLQGEQGLMVGDRIHSINGERIYTYSDLVMFLDRESGEPMDLVIERNGQKMKRNDLPLEKREYVVNGQTVRKFGIVPTAEKATVGVKLRESVYRALDFVRMVRIGLTDLFTGKSGLKDMSGVVGIVGMAVEQGEAGEAAGGVSVGIKNVIYLMGFIAVNLAVMNLLPIPALDGGRIFFLCVNSLFTLVTKRKIDPKYEGYVHTVGLILLLGLMVVVTFQDIVRQFGWG